MFHSSSYIQDEGQTAEIVIDRGGDTSVTSIVAFDTSDGTAVGGAACTVGVDYIITHQDVTFAPGVTTAVVEVPLCGDSVVEMTAESIDLTLSSPDVVPPGTAELLNNDTATAYRNTDAICTTLGMPADLYPSTITVSGGPAQIDGIRVTLYDLYHRLPDNLDVLLVGPQGQTFVLMGDAGGANPIDLSSPVTLTFSDSASQVLPNSAPLTTGLFEPTNWESPVTNFPTPAPAGPYNEPGSAVGGNGTETLNGVFGLTNPNGDWNLYVRDDGGLQQPAAITGCISGGWGLEFVTSTAAGASLSGRVSTADGRGIRNARVTISGPGLSEMRVATTSSFGYFAFQGLQVGQTYIVTVNSKRYTFAAPTRSISLVDNVSDVDFIADGD
jgi:hypothetical protein